VRLLWAPEQTWALWGAVSRAVRTPTRVDQNEFVSGRNVVLNPNFRSEELMAYEIGYRAQPERWFYWDLAWFYNNYTSLESTPLFAKPFFNGNGNRGQGYGIELSSKVDITQRWRLSSWYSFLGLQIQPAPGSRVDPSLNGLSIVGANPRNQVFLMSSWDVRRN